MATATLTLGSQNRWLADGSTTDWNFNFSGGYISTDHVFAYSLSNGATPIRNDYVITGASFVSQFVLRISPAVPSGHTLVIFRDSRNNGLPLADFVDGGGISETDLDAIARQSIFVNQETLDSATTQYQTSQPELFEQLSSATLAEVNAKLDLLLARLASVAAGEGISLSGVNNTLGYFTATTGQGVLEELAFRMLTRTALNVRDYDVFGDGRNDSAAMQAVINAATSGGTFRAIYAPAGNYYCPDGLVVDGQNIDRFTIIGDGRATDIWSDNAAVPVIDLKGSISNSFQHPKVRFLTVRNTAVGGVAIKTRWTEFLEIQFCTMSGGVTSGIALQMSSSANEQDNKANISHNLIANGHYGIRGGDTRTADATIHDNYFLNQTGFCVEFGWPDGVTFTGNKLFSDNGPSNGLFGLNFKKPIWTIIRDNYFFEMGGPAIRMSSPRACRVRDNMIVGVGDNARQPAIWITDYDPGVWAVEAIDNRFSGNTIKDTGGDGLFVDSSGTSHSGYTIEDNTFENCGAGSLVYAAMHLKKVAGSSVRRNKVDGKSATRDWLSLDAATNITLEQNEHGNVINADVLRANSPTMLVLPGTGILTGITATTTLRFDDDTLISGLMAAGFTVNLPSAASCPGKKFIIIKGDAGAFSITIDPASTQTINGALTKVLSTQYEVARLISDGANWLLW